VSETQEAQAVESQPSQDAAPRSDSVHVGQAARLGLLLRKAREARGLSIDDVIQALKFSRRQIEALEADDMASLPGSVFVRGSIRSYARFLRLDPEPLLNLLAEDVPVLQPDVRPPENMGTASPNRGIRRIPPLVAVSVLLLIAAAGMVVWHLFGDRFLIETPSLSTADPVPTNAAEQPSPTSMPRPPQPVSRTAVAEAPTLAPAPVVLQAKPRTLAFAFHGKCWVEVKDTSQQVILTGQFDQGVRQSVSGQPPFQIVLGNAASVDLVYEGQTIDLKPHTRAEVARLTLE
jgi:cytoskeleton protein RodZ